MVVVDLRADKHVVPDVIADTTAEVLHEVIGAFVVGHTRLGGSRSVEASIGGADASHKIEAKFLTQTWLAENVEVGQDGAVVYFLGDEGTLSCPPGGFDINTQAMCEEDHVAAEVDVEASLFRRLKSAVRRRGGRQE